MERLHPIYELSSKIVDDLAGMFPEVATELGIAGHDDSWTNFSPDGAVEALRKLRSLRAQVTSLPPPETDWDRLAIELAKTTLDEQTDCFEHFDHLRDLNSMASALQGIREVWDHMGRDSAEDWTNVIYRLERLPTALDGYRASLDEGRRRGMAVAERQVRAAVEQCRYSASNDSRYVKMLDDFESTALGGALRSRLESAVTEVRRSFDEFADYLADAYAVDAAEKDGVGRERYVRAAYEFLGSTIDPLQTYEWGWEQVADIRAQMAQVADTINSGAGIAAVNHLLRTDPARTVATAEDLRAFAAERLDTALANLAGTHFDVPDPIQQVTVNIAPPGSSLGAYYVGPSEDFARPGSVWWSLSPQGPYPIFDEVSTTYHEGFPGHHLQVGIQVSLAERLSRLHRLWVWKAGSGEGWALYAERLMNEWGFFDKPDYVFGWLAGQMLRACRVVIDIGSHLELPLPTGQPFHPGEDWTFATAVEMLEDYAMLNRPNAESEVTRYLGWPGQAISYKVGEQAILDIRDEVRRSRGDGFDEKAFHARLLEVGPVGLDLLRSELVG